MMGSHIDVESEYGKGSTFSFALEQGVKDWNPIGDYEESFKRSVSERKKYKERFMAPDARVLVVDDTPVNLSVFKNLLKRTKVQIDTAGSGDQGIMRYRNRHYDVIFLDHMMPDKDGIETLKEMKEIADTTNAGTPIVCLTANAISGMREMYINAGFDDYITKPIDPDRLEALLLTYLPKDKIVEASNEDNAADDHDTDDHDIPDFIKKIDALNVNSGIIHCGSCEDYMDTLKAYLGSGKKNADEIQKYWADKDVKNTTIKVHALKSTSYVIGAQKLGDFAARLEKAGEAGDVDILEKEIEPLLTQYRELVDKLEPLAYEDSAKAQDGTKDAKDKPLISDDDMKEAYDRLKEACNSYDYDSVADIVSKLEEYRFPEDEAARFEAIRSAVDNFDYDQIPQILAEKTN
jgi:CheY-like chemotaxis protein